MDYKSNVFFFKFLSKEKLKFPIVETGIIQNQCIEVLLANAEDGFIKAKFLRPLKVLTYFAQLTEINKLNQMLLSTDNSSLLYTYKQGKRLVHDISFIKDFVSKTHHKLGFDLVQKCIRHTDEKIHLAKVFYCSHNYETGFSIGDIQIFDQTLISNMIDVIRIILSAIEISLVKRVIKINLEFVKDFKGVLYLLNCKKLLVVEAKFTIGQTIRDSRELKGFIQMMLKKTRGEKYAKKFKTKKLEEKKNKEAEGYVFKKGQLRNLTSNIESPIRICTPDEESEEKVKFFKNELGKGRDFEKIRLSHSIQNLLSERKMKKNKNFSVSRILDEYLKGKKKSNRPRCKQFWEKIDGNLHLHKNFSTINLPKISKQSEQCDKTMFMELIFKTYFKNNLKETSSSQENSESLDKCQIFLNNLNVSKKKIPLTRHKGLKEKLEVSKSKSSMRHKSQYIFEDSLKDPYIEKLKSQRTINFQHEKKKVNPSYQRTN